MDEYYCVYCKSIFSSAWGVQNHQIRCPKCQKVRIELGMGLRENNNGASFSANETAVNISFFFGGNNAHIVVFRLYPRLQRAYALHLKNLSSRMTSLRQSTFLVYIIPHLLPPRLMNPCLCRKNVLVAFLNGWQIIYHLIQDLSHNLQMRTRD